MLMTIIIFLLGFILGIATLYFCSNFHKKYDGTLRINEARDSWEVAITEDPELIKLIKIIELKIEILD